jgi:hypothetical protein
MLLVRVYIRSNEYNLIEGEVYNAKHSTNKYYLDIYLPNGDIFNWELHTKINSKNKKNESFILDFKSFKFNDKGSE